MVSNWKSNADAPEMDGVQYHIQCKAGDVAPSVLAVAEAAGGIRIAPSSPIYQARPRMAVAPRAAARRRHSARPQPA